jgi:EAL domain-containing protein (putative c-di-GMP-specific phosphodiesterase class I)
MKKALNNQGFFIFNQPKYSLSTIELNSVEALIRWQHLKKGLISPNEFIKVAEKHDLILPITKWVLEQVSLQSKEWKELGCREVPISVNISAKHFEKGTLIEDVLDVIEKTAVDPKNLVFKITESVMIKKQENAIRTINELKNIGIKIELMISVRDFLRFPT